MLSLKRRKKNKIEADFYPEKIDLTEMSLRYVNLAEEIDAIFEKCLDQCNDKETINTLALLRGTIHSLLNNHKKKIFQNLKEISDQGFEHLKQYSANFFNTYHDQSIVIDKKGFQILFEPVLNTYLDHESILIQNIYNTLGGMTEKKSDEK